VTSTDVTAVQRSDLNDFLFADVGTEANGMTLSVVSIFARQGSDPWREAARLAELSTADATDSLARTIANMPRSLWGLPDAIVIAARLIGLLPTRSAIGIPRVAFRWPTWRSMAIMACIALALACGAAAMMQPNKPMVFDGSDVASFSTPDSGKKLAEGTHP
jgi:hypothetical protein